MPAKDRHEFGVDCPRPVRYRPRRVGRAPPAGRPLRGPRRHTRRGPRRVRQARIPHAAQRSTQRGQALPAAVAEVPRRVRRRRRHGGRRGGHRPRTDEGGARRRGREGDTNGRTCSTASSTRSICGTSATGRFSTSRPTSSKPSRTRLWRMEPLLGPTGPMAWRMLSVQSLLTSAAGALEARAAGRELSAADRDLLAQLPAVAATRRGYAPRPGELPEPVGLNSANPDRERQRESLSTPQYFFTPDGSLAMLTCRPKKAAQSFTPAKEANAAMRAILAEVEPRFPGVQLGLTGLPVLETDEMVLSDVDSTRASWLALLGVAVLYFVVYRGFRYPLLTLATLVVGTVWALGWATITVGHLNILSATFAVMLIGLGDYGVLWVAQYDECRAARRIGGRRDAAHGRTRRAEHRDRRRDDRAGVLRDHARRLQGGRRTRLDRRQRGAALCRELLAAHAGAAGADRAKASGGFTLAASSGRGWRRFAAGSRRTPSFPSPPRGCRASRVGRGWRWRSGRFCSSACGAFAARLAYDHNLLNLQAARTRLGEVGTQADRPGRRGDVGLAEHRPHPRRGARAEGEVRGAAGSRPGGRGRVARAGGSGAQAADRARHSRQARDASAGRQAARCRRVRRRSR